MSAAPGCVLLPPVESGFLLLRENLERSRLSRTCPAEHNLPASASSKIPVLSCRRTSEAGHVPAQRLDGLTWRSQMECLGLSLEDMKRGT